MPLPIRIETARLALVPVSARWTEDLHRLFNEPVVADWLFLTGPPTREEVEARTKGHEAVWRERGYGMFVVLEKATDRFVARVGPMVTPETGRIEIAWSTTTDAHGKGYASEAAKASIDFTFANSKLDALDCYLRPDNTASRRVAEKVGFGYQDTRFLYDRPLRYYKLARP
ncbi:MAG: GNAT family N-acetyltransferase [Micropepsaceae bacterium]